MIIINIKGFEEGSNKLIIYNDNINESLKIFSNAVSCNLTNLLHNFSINYSNLIKNKGVLMNVLELIEQTKESYQLGLINLEDIHNIDVTSFNKDNIFPDRIKVCDKDKTILEVEQYKIGYCQINKPIDKDSTDHLHIYTKDGSVNLARIKIIKDNLKRKLVFNKYLGIKLDTYIDYGFDVQELEEIFIPLNEEPYVFKHKGSYLTVKKLKASHFKRIK